MRDNFEYFAEPPQVAVRLTSTQTIPDSTWTTVSWDEAVWEMPSTMWDISAPTKIIIPQSDRFCSEFHQLYDTSAAPTDDRGIRLHREHLGDSHLPVVAGRGRSCSRSSRLTSTTMALDDELEVQVYQATGGDLDLLATRTRLTVTWSGRVPADGTGSRSGHRVVDDPVPAHP